jgi:endonuclease/exonuclease/phosphatase family metal-dependent hydrolase
MALTIATFNVKDLLDPRDAAEHAFLQGKLEWTARTLERIDADVLALQEVGSRDLLLDLARCLRPPFVPYGEPIVGTPDDRGIRCALFSRLPVLEARVHTAGHLDFPVYVAGDPPPFGARIPLRRGIVHGCVDAGALGRVHVLVVHFKSRLAVPLRTASGETIEPATPHERAEGELRALVRRAAEALFVRGLVDELAAKDPGAHIAVAGDFNDITSSVPVGVVSGDGDGALVSCAREVPPDRRFSVIHCGERAQIDHVLVTPALGARQTAARFLNEDLREHPPLPKGTRGAGAPGPAAEPPTVDSDHAPFVVCFE